MKFISSHSFLVYYFNNIMELEIDEYWSPAARVKEMRELIAIYKEAFRLQSYTDVQVWKIIKRKYNQNWDDLLHDMIEYEHKIYKQNEKHIRRKNKSNPA